MRQEHRHSTRALFRGLSSYLILQTLRHEFLRSGTACPASLINPRDGAHASFKKFTAFRNISSSMKAIYVKHSLGCLAVSIHIPTILAVTRARPDAYTRA